MVGVSHSAGPHGRAGLCSLVFHVPCALAPSFSNSPRRPFVVFPNKACLERCLNCSDTSVQGLSTDSRDSPSGTAPASALSSARSHPSLPQPSTPSPKSGVRELLCVLQSPIQSPAGPHPWAKSPLLCVPTSLRCPWAMGCIPHSVYSRRLTPQRAGGAAHLCPRPAPRIRQVAKVFE